MNIFVIVSSTLLATIYSQHQQHSAPMSIIIGRIVTSHFGADHVKPEHVIIIDSDFRLARDGYAKIATSLFCVDHDFGGVLATSTVKLKLVMLTGSTFADDLLPILHRIHLLITHEVTPYLRRISPRRIDPTVEVYTRNKNTVDPRLHVSSVHVHRPNAYRQIINIDNIFSIHLPASQDAIETELDYLHCRVVLRLFELWDFGQLVHARMGLQCRNKSLELQQATVYSEIGSSAEDKVDPFQIQPSLSLRCQGLFNVPASQGWFLPTYALDTRFTLLFGAILICTCLVLADCNAAEGAALVGSLLAACLTVRQIAPPSNGKYDNAKFLLITTLSASVFVYLGPVYRRLLISQLYTRHLTPSATYGRGIRIDDIVIGISTGRSQLSASWMILLDGLVDGREMQQSTMFCYAPNLQPLGIDVGVPTFSRSLPIENVLYHTPVTMRKAFRSMTSIAAQRIFGRPLGLVQQSQLLVRLHEIGMFTSPVQVKMPMVSSQSAISDTLDDIDARSERFSKMENQLRAPQMLGDDLTSDKFKETIASFGYLIDDPRKLNKSFHELCAPVYALLVLAIVVVFGERVYLQW